MYQTIRTRIKWKPKLKKLMVNGMMLMTSKKVKSNGRMNLTQIKIKLFNKKMKRMRMKIKWSKRKREELEPIKLWFPP